MSGIDAFGPKEHNPMNINKDTGAKSIKQYETRAGAVVLLTLIIAVSFSIYLAASKGLFERTYILNIKSEDATELVIGTPLYLSGLQIGSISKLKLEHDSSVTIKIKIPEKNVGMLRDGATFWSEKNIFGGSRLSVRQKNIEQTKLDFSKVYSLHVEDPTRDLPKLTASLLNVVRNLEAMTAQNSDLSIAIDNLSELSEAAASKQGILGHVLGNDTADTLMEAIKNTADLSRSLATSTNDLDLLRNDIDMNMQKINSMVDDVDRLWPFSTNSEITTP